MKTLLLFGFLASSIWAQTDILSESRFLQGGTPQNSKTEHLMVGGGGAATVLNYSGSPGYVSSLWIAISGNQNSMVNSVLTITVDGESTPAISTRIPLFFGSEYCWNTNNFGSRFIGCEQNGGSNIGYYAYIPIPFSDSITATVTNGDPTASMTMWAEANYTTGVADSWTRSKKLWVSSGTLTGLTVNQVAALVNVTGINQGRLFGVYMSIDSWPGDANPRPAPLEGNVKMYFDGASAPNYESSGTEDYFHSSNYFENVPSGFSTDYTGVPFKSDVTWNAFRFHVYDPMTFSNGLKVTWNCGDSTEVNFSGSVRLAYTVWYYTE